MPNPANPEEEDLDDDEEDRLFIDIGGQQAAAPPPSPPPALMKKSSPQTLLKAAQVVEAMARIAPGANPASVCNGREGKRKDWKSHSIILTLLNQLQSNLEFTINLDFTLNLVLTDYLCSKMSRFYVAYADDGRKRIIEIWLYSISKLIILLCDFFRPWQKFIKYQKGSFQFFTKWIGIL